jgi:hypothetical protein
MTMRARRVMSEHNKNVRGVNRYRVDVFVKVLHLEDVTAAAIGWAIRQWVPASAKEPTMTMVVGERLGEMAYAPGHGRLLRSCPDRYRGPVDGLVSTSD